VDLISVTLRVVGGDEKGSLESETVKYGCESQGTRTRERLRWQGPAAPDPQSQCDFDFDSRPANVRARDGQ
jgi:hypothetical protein